VAGPLSDRISLGVSASWVPRDAVEVTGKTAKRKSGKLPPQVMVYFVMALALFAEGSGRARSCPPRRDGCRLRSANDIIERQVTTVRESWADVCDLARLTRVQSSALFERQILNPYASTS